MPDKPLPSDSDQFLARMRQRLKAKLQKVIFNLRDLEKSLGTAGKYPISLMVNNVIRRLQEHALEKLAASGSDKNFARLLDEQAKELDYIREVVSKDLPEVAAELDIQATALRHAGALLYPPPERERGERREVSGSKSMVDRLAAKLGVETRTPEAPKKVVQQKASSMVDRLAAKLAGTEPTKAPSAKPIPAKKAASMVERLMKNAGRLLTSLDKVAEAKYHSLEEANKSVTKIFEGMNSSNEDLKETAKTLQEQNMDLMAAKLLDMSRALDEAVAFFQSKFPHLISWS